MRGSVMARDGETPDTATQILDVAERLAQVRGFNGFSYADVAGELKITKAALHYHFAGKAELGVALIAALLRPLHRSPGRGGGRGAQMRLPGSRPTPTCTSMSYATSGCAFAG